MLTGLHLFFSRCTAGEEKLHREFGQHDDIGGSDAHGIEKEEKKDEDEADGERRAHNKRAHVSSFHHLLSH